MATVKKKVSKKGGRPLRKVKTTKKPAVKAKKSIAKIKKKPAIKPAKKKRVHKKAVKPVKAKKAIKPARTAKSTKKKVVPPVVVAAKPPLPLPIVSKKSETKIGTVTHYYAQIGVAVVQLDQKSLHVGDTIHIKGHTTDFTQSVESMEVEHQPVAQAQAGDLFGLKVIQHVRESDSVFKV